MSYITMLGSPYLQSESDTIQDWYERYLLDPAGQIEMNGRVFYRIISKNILTTEFSKILLCNIDSRIKCRPGQNLIDEEGHIFKFLGITMIRFEGLPPEWYTMAPECMLEGNESEWGEYLAVESWPLNDGEIW